MRFFEISQEYNPPLPTKVYHVTDKKNRGSIKLRGLVPKIKKYVDISRTPGIFVFETFDQAKNWAWLSVDHEGESQDIWELSIDDPSILSPDPSSEMQEVYDAWVIYKPIPPSKLTLVGSLPYPNQEKYPSSEKIRKVL